VQTEVSGGERILLTVYAERTLTGSPQATTEPERPREMNCQVIGSDKWSERGRVTTGVTVDAEMYAEQRDSTLRVVEVAVEFDFGEGFGAAAWRWIFNL